MAAAPAACSSCCGPVSASAMGGQQSTINKLAMIRMGFMTHSKVQKVRFMSTEYQYL
jgi:hypothetical protein